MAIDPAGNIWIMGTNGLTAVDANGDEYSYYVPGFCTLSNSGVFLSPPGGYILGNSSTSFAIDGSGNGWIPSTTLLELSLDGSVLNGSGYILGNATLGNDVAIDGSGNFWVTASSINGVIKLSSSGSLVSGPNGYIGGGITAPSSVALDNSGNAWTIDSGYGISKFASSGAPLSGSSGFTSSLMGNPYAFAIDGSGNVWVANGYGYNSGKDNSIVELSPSGSLTMYIDQATVPEGYLDNNNSIAIDSSGDIWLCDGNTNTVTEYLGVATPVVTPVAANLLAPYNAPASKP
jgi:ligand-binding sensor domain-containing protein